MWQLFEKQINKTLADSCKLDRLVKKRKNC